MGRGEEKKRCFNPINPNVEAIPASLKHRELGRVQSWALLAETQEGRGSATPLISSHLPPQAFALLADLRGAVWIPM